MTTRESAASMLRDIRREQGYSLRSAAAEIGIAPSQLSRMERGQRPVADAVAAKLTDYYQVSAEVLDLARGVTPSDILEILSRHPEEILRLRATYGHEQ